MSRAPRSAALTCLLLAACRVPEAPRTLTPAPATVAAALADTPADAPASPPPPSAPPAPREPAAVLDLDVPKHPAAVVFAPADDGRRHPLVVATHGAGGTPEKQCALWRDLLGDGAFILCPRGVTMDVYAPPEARGYFYSNHPALGREVRAALAALRARFGDRVDDAGAVYAGFSQGATMGALVLAPDPAPFATFVLVEGGHDEWTLKSASAFRDGHGRRVLFVCGRDSCADGARRSAAILTRAGVDARLVDKRGAGHTYAGPVHEAVRGALEFILGDDARFRASPAP